VTGVGAEDPARWREGRGGGLKGQPVAKPWLQTSLSGVVRFKEGRDTGHNSKKKLGILKGLRH